MSENIPSEDQERLIRLLVPLLAQLGEHFVAVQMFCCHEDSGVSQMVQSGFGNRYTREAMTRDFIIASDAVTQSRAIKTDQGRKL